MKIRNGFVSNSSSSSFVVLLPKNFDADMFIDNMEDDEIENIMEEHNMKSKNQIKKILRTCVKDNGTWNEEEGFYMCTELLDEFVIATVEGGPDDGSLSIMSEKEKDHLKDLLFKEIRYDKLKKIENENVSD